FRVLSDHGHAGRSGTGGSASPVSPVFFAPMWSAGGPRTSRSSAPPSTGTATIRPFRESESSPRSAIIELARAPTIIQTMQLIVKYRNAQRSVGRWPARRNPRRSIGWLPARVSGRGRGGGHDGLHPGPRAFGG